MLKNYSPLRTVAIENFQAIASTSFDLGNLTVLVGEGDVGKSSIIRAIRAAFLNDGDDLDIRHGEKRATVTLTFDDETVITWWKDRGKGGCYRLNDQEFLKTGGQVPEEIKDYLGIGVLEVDGTTTLTPQLSDQHDLPFILWETGSKRARIIGQATNLDVVVRAQMQCKKELDGLRREVTTKGESVGELTDALADLPDFNSLDARALESEETLALVESTQRRLTKAQELADTLEEVQSRAISIDVAPLLQKLDDAETTLVLLEQGDDLAINFPAANRTLESLEEARANHEEALQSFTLQLEEACTNEGVCVICGGLLNHEECTDPHD
jgi:DNA repair ATPase RecN